MRLRLSSSSCYRSSSTFYFLRVAVIYSAFLKASGVVVLKAPGRTVFDFGSVREVGNEERCKSSITSEVKLSLSNQEISLYEGRELSSRKKEEVVLGLQRRLASKREEASACGLHRRKLGFLSVAIIVEAKERGEGRQ